MEDINQKIKTADRRKLGELLWPESNIQTRRTLACRIARHGVKRLTPEQFEKLKTFLSDEHN